MSTLSYLRKAIVGVCEGNLGAVRTVDSAGARYAGATRRNERVQALIAPRFDVLITSGRRHTASPLGTSTVEIKEHDVSVDVTHALGTEVVDSARNDVRDAVTDALEEIVAALAYPNNLSADGDGNPTGCCDGMLVGPNGSPTWELVNEDWAAKLIRSRIRGTAIVQHTRDIT